MARGDWHLVWAIGIVLCVGVGYLLLGYMAMARMVAAVPDTDGDLPGEGLVCERVDLAGGTAWLIRTPDTESHRVVVTIPAFGGSRSRLQGQWMGGYWQAATEAGFSVLALPNFTVPTVMAAIRYLKNRDQNSKIVLHGFSIGASIAAFAASRNDVAACVADGLADDLLDAMFVDFRKNPILRLIAPSIRVNLQWSRKIYPSALRGLESIRRITCPVLLVYGSDEPIMGQALNSGLMATKLARDGMTTWIVPDVGHCMAATEKCSGYFAQISALVQ